MPAASRSRFISAVLLPLLGGPESLDALPVAQRIAELPGPRLHLLHLAERPSAEIPSGIPGDTIHERIIGDPAGFVVSRARALEGSIIVLPARAGGQESASGLAPFAEAVIRATERPVVLVPPGYRVPRWHLRKVLLPQDGTPGTAEALQPAVKITRIARAELLIAHIFADGKPSESGAGTLTAPRYIDQPQHEWPAWQREFMERVRCLGKLPQKIRLQLLVAEGDPGAEIVSLARKHGADLIILPWHGVLAPERAETLRKVIRESPCPVVTVRFEAQEVARERRIAS